MENIEKNIKDFLYFAEFGENKSLNTIKSLKKDLSQLSEYLKNIEKIGSVVEKGDIIAVVGENYIYSPISGVLRGIIRDGYKVSEGLKIADVDPRIEEKENCFTISDKARNIGGAVLEAVLYLKKIKGV